MRNPTRRDVLRTGVSLSGGVTAWNSIHRVVSADDAKNDGHIDAHSHIWTRDIQHYPLKEGATLVDLDPPSFTTAELLATACRENVSRVVLIAHTQYYGFDNRYMTDAAAQHPERFRVVGMVDDKGPNPEGQMKRLLSKHVTGFRIVPWIRGDKWLDNAGMKAMWQCAAETRQAICCLIDPENLPEVDRMCQRYPETRVVIDHFGRIGIDGQIRATDLNNLTNLARHKHTYVKLSAYYALGEKKPPYHDLVPMIRRLYETFGAERLMWASDAPYQIVGDHTYGASISLIRDHIDFVSREDRDCLLRKTAQRVFFHDT